MGVKPLFIFLIIDVSVQNSAVDGERLAAAALSLAVPIFPGKALGI
jgi:hypothetical protein